MENLKIYQKALELVSKIYIVTRNPKLVKDCSLCDQLRRAAVSIVANIAEGYLRTRKHFRSYLSISSGSANEVVALLQVVELVYSVGTGSLQDEFKYLAKQISAFSRRLI